MTSPHAHLVGRMAKVWINTELTTPTREHPVQFTVGHTKAYIKVLLPLDPQLVGTVAVVNITGASRWHVTGEVASFRKVHPHLASADGAPYTPSAFSAASRGKVVKPKRGVEEGVFETTCGGESKCCGSGDASCGSGSIGAEAVTDAAAAAPPPTAPVVGDVAAGAGNAKSGSGGNMSSGSSPCVDTKLRGENFRGMLIVVVPVFLAWLFCWYHRFI